MIIDTFSMYKEVLNLTLIAHATKARRRNNPAVYNYRVLVALYGFIQYRLALNGVVSGFAPIDCLFNAVETVVPGVLERALDPWFINNAVDWANDVCRDHTNLLLTDIVLDRISDGINLQKGAAGNRWFGVVDKDMNLVKYVVENN